jgi:Dolichyl-phosphate-mannose-protein mannosyltransferase
MESSRTRNSILDWLIAATLAFAAISGLAGINVDFGGISLSSHSAWRVLALTGVLIAIRRRMTIESAPLWITRLVWRTAICGSAGTWFRFLLLSIGGADSYGYVSAGQLIAQGSLVADAPIAGWLSAANRLALASPLGWAPAADGSGIVPTYPLGLPLLMAFFSAIGGTHAVFFVAPCAAAITLFLVHRLTRSWFDADTALLTTALAAWNPLFIAYAKQPMSDVPAAMWTVLAMSLAVRSTSSTAFAAGLAGGLMVITRPALLPAAAAIVFVAHRGDIARRRAALAAGGLAIGVLILMLIQQLLFGSPFSTGYGTTSALFSVSHVATNLVIFIKHGWFVAGPLWILGVIIGVFAARPEPRTKPLIVFAAVALPYLFYLPFDHWETLRYLLPGMVILTVTVGSGLMRFARATQHAAATAIMLCAFTVVAVGQSELLLRRSEAWNIADLEARYPLAGEWININTPANSVVLANQHSGSLRWYGRRQTLRWDFIAPEDLTRTVNELESQSAIVYVALEGAEVEMFDARFARVIDQLQVDHVGRIRNVTFLRLTTR